MKRPTIRDVAARAGVSHQTVSRVINHDRAVSGPTRDLVLAAIQDLNYLPNGIARSLSSSRTRTLGVVTANISDFAFSQTAAGAEAEARRRGFFLLIGSVADATDEAEERAYLDLMLERRVEGLILDWPTLRIARNPSPPLVVSRVPLVTIAAAADLPSPTVVDVDNRRGGFDATSFLIAQGHRAIATITGPLHWNAAVARLQGFRDALDTAGLAERPVLVQSCPGWDAASGQEAAARLLAGRPRITAIFAQSDLLALGTINALRASGMRVPEDVSVIGYDDIPVASYLDPPLTTIRQPIREVGALAAKLLIDEITSGVPAASIPARHLLPTALVIRGSVRSLTT